MHEISIEIGVCGHNTNTINFKKIETMVGGAIVSEGHLPQINPSIASIRNAKAALL